MTSAAMTPSDERRLLRMMARHGIAEFDFMAAGRTISLQLEPKLHPEIRCRQAGFFLHRHPTDVNPTVFPRAVGKGDVVAYIKVGALLLPIVSSVDGWLPEPLRAHGEAVGYGDVLF